MLPYSDKVYNIPILYSITHVLIGVITIWYPYIGIAFLLYQFIQYMLDVRVFIFSGEIKKGNNIYHTSYKLLEMCIGMIIGYIAHSYFQ